MIKQLYEQWKRLNDEYEEAYNTRLRYSAESEYGRETRGRLLKKEIELDNRIKEIESKISNTIKDRIYEVEEGKFIIFDEYRNMYIIEEYKDDQGIV